MHECHDIIRFLFACKFSKILVNLPIDLSTASIYCEGVEYIILKPLAVVLALMYSIRISRFLKYLWAFW